MFKPMPGEINCNAKLTEIQVREIRKAREGYDTHRKAINGGPTLSQLAEKYGVAKQHIWLIANHKSWKHLK